MEEREGWRRRERNGEDSGMDAVLTLGSSWMIRCKWRLMMTEPRKRSSGEQR